MKSKRIDMLWLVLAGFGVYLILFYATGLPSLKGDDGNAVRRIVLVLVYLVRPDDLLAQWVGARGEFSLVDRLPVLAIAGVILAYSFSLGWLVMALFRADRGLGRLETFVLSTAVGLNVVSTYVLLVGLVGWLGNVLVFALPAALTLAATLTLGAVRRLRLRRPAESAQDPKRPEQGKMSSPAPIAHTTAGGGLSPRWLWLAAPFVLVILLGGMLPPIEFDVREYHLQVPKEFFQEGRIGFLRHNVYGNMPMGTEMLSLLAMVIAGDWWLGALAGKTVIAAFAPLTALGLLAAGRRLFSPTAGVVAAVVYVSTPWIVQVSTNGLVEGASACYLLAAVYTVLVWRSSSRGPLLLLAGYLAGGAVATKYPAALFVLLPLALGVLLKKGGRSRFSFSGAWKRLTVFLVAAVVGCGLWFGKNWVFTGNPTYPLLYSVFDSQQWSLEKNQRWNQAHRPDDFSPRTLAADLARVGLTSEWLSPLLFPLAALAFFRNRGGNGFPRRTPAAAGCCSGGDRPKSDFPSPQPSPATGEGAYCSAAPRNSSYPLFLLAYFGFVIAGWWLLTHRIDRFWIPALPVVALLAGAGACWRRDRAWRGVLTGLLVLGAVSNFLVATSGPGGYNRYFVGLKQLRHAPGRVDPWHRYFNSHRNVGRVLLVGDAQPFDLEVPVLYNTVFDDSVFQQLVAGRTAEEARAALLGRGVTHVFVHWGEIERYRSPGNYGFTDFVQPAVFARLVQQGVLQPLPQIEGHPGRAYRVLAHPQGVVRQ